MVINHLLTGMILQVEKTHIMGESERSNSRPYEGVIISSLSLDNPLTRPYFFGGGWHCGVGPLDSHNDLRKFQHIPGTFPGPLTTCL